MNLPLFDTATTLARSNDPQTSKDAARDFVHSGKLAEAENLAYFLILSHPGNTARELEELKGLERCTVKRRVASLVRKGLVIKGEPKKQPNGRSAATLYTKTAFHAKEATNAST